MAGFGIFLHKFKLFLFEITIYNVYTNAQFAYMYHFFWL